MILFKKHFFRWIALILSDKLSRIYFPSFVLILFCSFFIVTGEFYQNIHLFITNSIVLFQLCFFPLCLLLLHHLLWCVSFFPQINYSEACMPKWFAKWDRFNHWNGSLNFFCLAFIRVGRRYVRSSFAKAQCMGLNKFFCKFKEFSFRLC